MLIASLALNAVLGAALLWVIYRRRHEPPTPTMTGGESDSELITLLLDEQRNTQTWLKF